MSSSRGSDTSPYREYSSMSNYYIDPAFTAEISGRMQVPKRIQLVNSQENLDNSGDEINGNMGIPNGYAEKMNMKVPDRILVAGQEKHIGARAIPRELQLESTILPPDPEIIRIQTPPRSITINQNSNLYNVNSSGDDGDDETLVVEDNRASFVPKMTQRLDYKSEVENANNSRKQNMYYANGSFRGDEKEDVAGEVDHLRNEMTRIKDRVVSLEKETNDLKEKEQYFLIAGLAYFAYHVISWLCRSNKN